MENSLSVILKSFPLPFSCFYSVTHCFSIFQFFKQIYYTGVRAQIINHMRHIENFLPNINCLLDSYLANSHIARNKVRVKGTEILSPASHLSTDMFVYT